jgi:hypothetical protein
VLALGIRAKHSNEDGIAPFGQWIARYGDRIALLGGFDMDFLCVAGRLEGDLLHAEFASQGLRVDPRDSRHVGLSSDHGCQLCQLGGVRGIQFQDGRCRPRGAGT